MCNMNTNLPLVDKIYFLAPLVLIPARSFSKIGIKNKNCNNLFPENDKIHKMKTRAVENYKVQHANTKRLYNSSIIAMQKMLNHDISKCKKDRYSLMIIALVTSWG